MDEVDSAIVRLLREDARQSNRDIARKVGIAPSTCLERIRLLRKRGVIHGYHADIDLTALNRGVQAIVATQIRPPLTRDDFLVHVTAQDIDHLHEFVLERFTSRREIVGFRTSIVYQHRGKQVLDPLPDVRH